MEWQPHTAFVARLTQKSADLLDSATRLSKRVEKFRSICPNSPGYQAQATPRSSRLTRSKQDHRDEFGEDQWEETARKIVEDLGVVGDGISTTKEELETYIATSFARNTAKDHTQTSLPSQSESQRTSLPIHNSGCTEQQQRSTASSSSAQPSPPSSIPSRTTSTSPSRSGTQTPISSTADLDAPGTSDIPDDNISGLCHPLSIPRRSQRKPQSNAVPKLVTMPKAPLPQPKRKASSKSMKNPKRSRQQLYKQIDFELCAPPGQLLHLPDDMEKDVFAREYLADTPPGSIPLVEQDLENMDTILATIPQRLQEQGYVEFFAPSLCWDSAPAIGQSIQLPGELSKLERKYQATSASPSFPYSVVERPEQDVQRILRFTESSSTLEVSDNSQELPVQPCFYANQISTRSDITLHKSDTRDRDLLKQIQERELLEKIQENLKLRPILNSIPGNHLAVDGKPLPWTGVAWSYLYFGQRGSSFEMHDEDQELLSINYVHRGEKRWVIIEPDSKDRLMDLAQERYGANVDKCDQAVRHLSMHFSYEELEDHGIKYHVEHQTAGVMLVTLPRACHQGQNMIDTVSEAVNVQHPAYPTRFNYKVCGKHCGIHQNIVPPPEFFTLPMSWGRDTVTVLSIREAVKTINDAGSSLGWQPQDAYWCTKLLAAIASEDVVLRLQSIVQAEDVKSRPFSQTNGQTFEAESPAGLYTVYCRLQRFGQRRLHDATICELLAYSRLGKYNDFYHYILNRRPRDKDKTKCLDSTDLRHIICCGLVTADRDSLSPCAEMLKKLQQYHRDERINQDQIVIYKQEFNKIKDSHPHDHDGVPALEKACAKWFFWEQSAMLYELTFNTRCPNIVYFLPTPDECDRLEIPRDWLLRLCKARKGDMFISKLMSLRDTTIGWIQGEEANDIITRVKAGIIDAYNTVGGA